MPLFLLSLSSLLRLPLASPVQAGNLYPHSWEKGVWGLRRCGGCSRVKPRWLLWLAAPAPPDGLQATSRQEQADAARWRQINIITILPAPLAPPLFH